MLSQKIQIVNVTKLYKGIPVLNNISETFISGKIYGFIGRNGSGKTMLLKAISGFIKLDEGFVEINGEVVGKDIDFPRNAGIIIETPAFDGYLTGFQNLYYLAKIRKKVGREEIQKSMEMVGLDYHSSKRVRQYSLGMKQRLAIAQAIMENPDILILDEPTNTLDEEAVGVFRKILMNEKDGKVIFIASHNKEDIETLCDVVFKLENGFLKKL